jgi:hypothetical protein
VDDRKAPTARGLSPELIDFWKGLCERNQRKCKPAHRELVRRFFAGEDIPGLEPGIARDRLPMGLSYDNLMRHQPSEFELKVARIGRSAGASHRPLIHTTRVGMDIGQQYMFDDIWHDFKVAVLGQRRTSRLLQLHALDVFSGCQFARGCKPRIEDEMSGRSIGLKENEMLFLTLHCLSEYGYDPRGCTLLVEHGTAALSEEVEKMLADVTGGVVTVSRSGIEGASAFAGAYGGRSKGNFRLKASLESLGNLIHNETGSGLLIPGQTGSNSRINLPEELHGRDRHHDALARAMVALPEHRRNLLRLPVLELNQAIQLIEDIQERINRRTDHELEGWLEAGLTTVDYHVPGVGLIPGHELARKPAAAQDVIIAAGEPMPRRLSPREVFDSRRHRLARLRPEQVARVMASRMGREVTVKNHAIVLQDAEISPAPLRYLAHHFADGTKFKIVVNPFSPKVAHLFDSAGRWVGVVELMNVVSRVDIDGLHAEMGRAREIERELLEPVARRGAELTRQRIADARHNAEVLSDAPMPHEPRQSGAERLETAESFLGSLLGDE